MARIRHCIQTMLRMKLAPQVVMCMLLGACGYESGRELGDGYLHVDTDAWNTWVIHDGQAVVDTNVTHVLSLGNYIVGVRVKPQRLYSRNHCNQETENPAVCRTLDEYGCNRDGLDAVVYDIVIGIRGGSESTWPERWI